MALECVVCLEAYDVDLRIPRILPCSGAHDLCTTCLDEIRPNGESFACPQCREDIPSGARINENRLLLQSLRQRRGSLAKKAAKRPKRRTQAQATTGISQPRLRVLLGWSVGVALLAILAVACWRLWPVPIPVDALLEPSSLWSDALVALNEGRNADAAWQMLIALFLDWSYNDGRYLPDVLRALEGCREKGDERLACGYWSLALGPLVELPGKYPETRFESAHSSLASLVVSGRKDSNSAAPLGGHEDRIAFAAACAAVFYARDLSKAFMIATSVVHAPGSSEALRGSRKSLKLVRQAQGQVSLAATYIEPGRYLTLMFEFAYTHRQIHAMAAGTQWSNRFQAAAPVRPNAHWQFFLKKDRYAERVARESAEAMRSGMTHEEMTQWMADKVESADERYIDLDNRKRFRAGLAKSR